MTEDEKKILAQMQIDGVCALLKGTVSYSSTLDYLGNSARKITIIYDEKNEKASN
tara:strand:- start:156 stop:320 length:165 start_codon:yes stop_codon:yes gene_type:complete